MEYRMEIHWNKRNSKVYDNGRVVRCYNFVPQIGMSLQISRLRDGDIINYKQEYIDKIDEENVKTDSIWGEVYDVSFYEYAHHDLYDENLPGFSISIKPEE